ncbi:hypothetical protein [Yinghuangia sp. YIM S09857]|uniref:hypothetical protein n=1 Tax=Yinghuangia sp. YIM S09857 TaxID=3436929 RepID=UPI003F52F883
MIIDESEPAWSCVRTTTLLAEVAARVATRRGALAGLLSASELVADPSAEEGPEPDAVAVVAVAAPGDNTTRIAWVGDARAWGWDVTRLRQYSTDQTMGQFLRVYGGPAAELAGHHDEWVRASLAAAAVATVREAEVPDRLVLLTTDGMHDTVGHEEVEALLRAHENHPQAPADALAAAAREGRTGERDDATAVALLHPSAPTD